MTLLLLITLEKVNNIKEQMGQKEIQNVPFGEKKSTRKLNGTSKECAAREGVTVK